MKEFLKVLKIKNYRYLFVSQALSGVIINMLSFLILLRLFDDTGSSIATSLLWVTYSIPALVVGPFASAFADLVDRRKVLMISNFSQAMVILFYAFFPGNKFFISYAVVFLYSFFNQFYVPAESATLPSVVPKNYLTSANGIFFLSNQLSFILGFGIAGLLYELLGFRPSLILSSFGLFSAFICVSLLPSNKSIKKQFGKFEVEIREFFERIIEGYLFIKNHNAVLYPILLLVSVQVISAVLMINLPVLATNVLNVPPARAGVMVVAPAGIGALIGTMFVSKFASKGIRKRKVIDMGLIGMALILLSLSFIVPHLPMIIKTFSSLLLFGLFGGMFVLVIIPAMTFMQEATPGGLMGRVFGNFWFLSTMFTILPVIFSGTISEVLSVNVLLSIIATFCIVAYIFSNKLIKI